MKDKLHLAKLTMLVALMSVSAHAVVKETPKLNGLKIAVIKDAVGTEDIIAGNYHSGLDKLATADASSFSDYDKAMGVCVANIKLNSLTIADKACTDAIDAMKALSGRGRHGQYLKALAYSNRAIVRYLAKDNSGAMEDFTSALLIDNNDIVKGNIIALRTIDSTPTELALAD